MDLRAGGDDKTLVSDVSGAGGRTWMRGFGKGGGGGGECFWG